MSDSLSLPEKPQGIPVDHQQLESLDKCIREIVTRFKHKKKWNKVGAIVVQVATVLFSIGTTVLIGWQMQKGDDGKLWGHSTINLALIVSALATGTTALEKFFDYKVLWINYSVSIAGLNGILHRSAYLRSIGAEHLQQHQIEELYTRFENICSDMNKVYRDTRAAKDE